MVTVAEEYHGITPISQVTTPSVTAQVPRELATETTVSPAGTQFVTIEFVAKVPPGLDMNKVHLKYCPTETPKGEFVKAIERLPVFWASDVQQLRRQATNSKKVLPLERCQKVFTR